MNIPLDLRRRQISACGLALPFVGACKPQAESIHLDVVLFSYLDRPIFDVRLNRIDIGVAGAWPDSGRGTMTGVLVPLGGQKVSWRLDGPKGAPRNGKTVTAKNLPVLQEVTREARFLAVHLYADDTVELLASEHFPGLSDRGQAFDLAWRQRHGE